MNIEKAFAKQKCEGLQLFAHGRKGEILIDNKWHNAEQIAQWLQQNQLNIYACNFAKGKKGKAAVQYLEETLDICVAASDDITGIDGDWELEVGYSSNNLAIENYAYNLQCANPLPTATAYALAASCTNGVPNDDAYLQISAATNAIHYNFVMGSDYTSGDVDIANAIAFNPATDLPLQFGTLANPTDSAQYTIRVFNGDSDCFADVTVTLNETPLPTLIIDGATCDAGDTTYTIDFTSDATVTSDVGTVAGNQIIDIPTGTNVTITAELNGCTNTEIAVSPNCGSNCPTTKCMEVNVTKI